MSTTQAILEWFNYTLKIVINVKSYSHSALAPSLLMQPTGEVSRTNCSLFMMNQTIELEDIKNEPSISTDVRMQTESWQLQALDTLLITEDVHLKGRFELNLSFIFSIICQADGS